MAVSTPRCYVADIAQPNPAWSDGQRNAWKASHMLQLASLELHWAWEQRSIPSYEPVERTYLAWLELEREIAVVGLFDEEAK